MKVWEFITGLFLHTNRNGFTLIEDWASIIMQINFCLTEVYARATRLRYWQLKTERFDMKQTWESFYRMVTSYPVIQINWIYNAEFNNIEKVTTRPTCWGACNEYWDDCVCKPPETPWCDWCCTVWTECDECSACTECTITECYTCPKVVPLTEVAAWSPLELWSYSIWWGKYGWGQYGNVIYVKPKDWLHAVYVSYYSFFNFLTCLDDIIPLPDSYLAALNYLVTWYIVPAASNYRTGDEKFFIEQGLRLLDEVDKYNNHAPQSIQPKRS